MNEDDELDILEGDEKIIAEAKSRFDRCQKYYSTFRQRFIDDIKFCNADSDNGYQWPNDLQRARIDNDRPTVTINKVRTNNNLIINDGKKNTPSVKIRPTGEGASFEASEVYEGIIRHIQYISNASITYNYALSLQVDAGKAFWRILTDYADNDTFDQEIFIKRVVDTLSVYEDPDIKEVDGSDANFYFIFDDVLRADFIRMHPEYRGEAPRSALDNNDTWISEKHIRVAEYYRLTEKKDKLIAYKMQDGSVQTALKSKLAPEIVKGLLEDPETKVRTITNNVVEWYKIAGDQIVDRRVGKDAWKGKYIPVIRVVGHETVIEGVYDCKGHTRCQKDSQRMYNYNSSASIEYGALQTKAPWLAPAQAIEENIEVWKSANVKNYSVLPYNHIDDDGNPIPPPQRIEPPQGAAFYVEERQACANDLMFVTGQYEAATGEFKPEQSGKAINERQHQSETANFHYIDNQAIGITFTGKQLIDLIPKIYDTPRVMKILAEDGAESEIMLDPNAKKAYQQKQKTEQDVVAGIFNPNIGKYDVQADVGPNYQTKRMEAFNALTQIATSNEQFMTICGDILFKAADFPGADEVAERYKRMIPPQALGEGASQQDQKMQEQMQKMQKMLEAALTELATEKLKLKGKDMQKDIDTYEAITKRMEALFKHVIPTPKDSASMLHDVITQEHQSNLNMVEADAQHGMNMEMADNEVANAPSA